ncbi:MAG TPA: DsbA family protein [Candidatus Binatia bacterium]|nr:DsbA family protein [Candidatus Binatia bacterium]
MVHRLTLYFDYHCPYCFRVERWLADLGTDRVAVDHRFLSLEQLNRDPEATDWRIWDQPLDYEHHRGRPERRSLAAFLATAVAEGAGGRPLPPALVERLRSAIFAARHEERLDISRLEILDRIAATAGLGPGWVTDRLADPSVLAAARARIAADWEAARSPFRLFGVPTLVVDDGPPVYLRLERVPTATEAERLLEWLGERAAALPFVLELKLAPPSVEEAGPRG